MEVIAAFTTDVEEDHPGFFSFGLVLVEYTAGAKIISEGGTKERSGKEDALVVAAFWTCHVGVGLCVKMK